MGRTLRLEVADFGDADHWRWVLKEDGGRFLDDHAVALDRANPNYMGLVDLPSYLWRNAAPDTRDADERRLIREVGAWIGDQVLGRSLAEKLLGRAKPSVVVRVLVPPPAERLVTIPLEIARLEGEPLSMQGVSFVFETAGMEPPEVDPVRDRLRILALFSLPPAGSPLNLRRERQMLRELVRYLSGAQGLGVELQVLQYGVTRDSLQDVLQQGEGWDVIHFSGHGLPGWLWLEKADGSPDEVSATELAQLLGEAGGRVKLVTLSACLSAAASIDQTLDWLGLGQEAAPRRRAATEPAESGQEKGAPTVARALTETVGCAVLAMRYAVEDEFAVALARELYDRLFRQRQSLPVATRQALASAVRPKGDGVAPGVLSAAAPALFGSSAAELVLAPPRRRGEDAPDLSLAYIPKQPAHFVGRVGAMTQASAALAGESERSGVLFNGMAGA
ncbi:MAG TPA: CHAT domain-containing protein, partial [Acetobacteraceae bacterium]|nr:CHAT domain-containing protein [Acetobacteraceae bacterium]